VEHEAPQEPLVTPRIVRFTVLLAAIMGLPSLATFAVGALGPSIVSELELSRTQLGLIGSVVSLTAVGGSLLLGRLVDGFGARAVTFGLVAGSAVSLLVLAAAPVYPVLLAMGVVAGLAQACANPVTNSLISQFAPLGRRGIVMGVKQSGVQVAQFFVGFTLPPISVAMGWRTSVAVTLVLVILVGVWGYRDLPRVQLPHRSPAQVRSLVPERAQLRRDLLWLCIYTFTLALAVQPVNIYLPLYAFESGLLSITGAGATVGVIGAVGVCARILVGRLVTRLPAPSICLGPMALIAVMSMFSLATAASNGLAWLWLGAALFAVSALAGNVVIMLTLLARVSGGSTGHASGLVSASMFVGFAAGPFAFGLLVDATDSYASAWSMIAGSCSLAMVVGFGIYYRRGMVVPDHP
jgi:predicted MFS family arabinose efflux permease